MDPVTCSLIFHNYYGQHENWVRFFSEKITVPFTLFYNVVEDSLYNQEENGLYNQEEDSLYGPDQYHRLSDRLYRSVSGPWLKKIVLCRSPNQGKDIGGKLVLLDALMQEPPDGGYIVFLHDKRSPHKIQSQQWADQLFGIIEPEFVRKALSLFDRKKDLGLIAAAHSIHNEYDPSLRSFISNNGSQLTRLRQELNILNKDYRYVAGTMFWARAAPLLDFFGRFPPLDIRKTLEKGNVMDETAGSITHAWERLFSWLIFAQGYTIKGL
jgi:lipopolysaccharide biosynthesis protein